MLINPNFESLLEWQVKLADLIIITQKEIDVLKEKESLLTYRCRSSLAQFYLGLNEKYQQSEQELLGVQQELFEKQQQLNELQKELEDKIEAIIECYREQKQKRIQEQKQEKLHI